MLEMVHCILLAMKHVIYGSILSVARGSGGVLQAPPAPQRKPPPEIEFDAFWPENLTSGGTHFSFSLTFP